VAVTWQGPENISPAETLWRQGGWKGTLLIQRLKRFNMTVSRCGNSAGLLRITDSRNPSRATGHGIRIKRLVRQSTR
jgi:hypothetical protein